MLCLQGVRECRFDPVGHDPWRDALVHSRKNQIGSSFLTKDGVLPRELFSDLMHPAAEGYVFWPDAIAT